MRPVASPTPHPDPAAPGWGAMVLLILATGVITGASSMIIVVLPAISRALQASLAQGNWVVDAFTLAVAVSILGAGALADRVGLRRALLGALALMIPVQVVGALAQDVAVLIGARLVGGLIGAVLYAAVLGHVVSLWTGPARTGAIARWGMGLGIVAMINPPLAGWLESLGGWRLVVAVTPALALLTLIAAWRWLPAPTAAPRRPADWASIALAGLAVAALLAGVNLVAQGSAAAWPLVATGIVVGAVFVRRCLHQPDAPIPLGQPGTRAMLVAAGVGFFTAGLLFSFNQTMEHYVQDALRLDATEGGLLFALGGATSALGSRLAGPLMLRLSMRSLLAGGMGVFSLASWLAALSWNGTASVGWVAASIVGLAVAFGLTATAATHAITAQAPAGREAAVSALTGLTRYLGGALGLAALGAVLADAYGANFLAAQLDVPAGLARELAHSYALAQHWAQSHPALAAPVMSAARSAIVAGADAALMTNAVVATAWTACVAWLYPGGRAA